MSGSVFDRPNSWVASSRATELFVCRTVLYQEVAEVFTTVSQDLPPVVT